MPFFQLVSVKLSLGLVLGILIGYYFEPSLLLSSVLLATCFIGLFLVYRLRIKINESLFGITSACTTVALGIFIIVLSNPKNQSNHYTHAPITTEATFSLRITEVLKPTQFTQRYIANVQMLDSNRVSGKLLLRVPKDSIVPSLAVDDTVIGYGKMEEIPAALNPHQFDYGDYMKKQGIQHQLYFDHQDYIRIKTDSKSLKGMAYRFRELCIEKLKEYPFGKDELSVLEAILLGQRNDLSSSTYDNYKDAGAVHILAVSGLHVGIVLLILQFLLAPLRRWKHGQQIQLFLILLLLWGFAFIAGLSPSIVRAVTMFSFVSYGLYLKRPTHPLNTIALSFFFLLLVKPLYLFEVGFQMSYAAVFSIVWLYPKLQRFWNPQNFFLRKTWQLLTVSFTAQLGVLPISLFYFHQFPGLFFVSNLIIVPFLGILLGTGILVILLALIGVLPQFLAISYNSAITWMNQTVGWVAQQESFLFRDVSFDGVQLLLSYMLILGLVFVCIKPKFQRISWALLSVLLLQGYTIFQLRHVNNKEQLIIAHQTANTIILHQNGNQLQVLHKNERGLDYLLPNFAVSERIGSVAFSGLSHSYQIAHKSFFIVDSSAIYPNKTVDYLLLTQSPKLNLERLLDSISVGQVLVDGSNYKSSVALWKTTCKEKEIPFHYTGEKGAFYFDLEHY